MDLDQIAGEPAYTATVKGRDYRFSELPLTHLAKLQAWVRQNVPHPLEAVKPHLAGLEPEDRAALLDSARRDALHWPPKVGTRRAAAVLLGTEEGQVETLYHALTLHHPETTPADARAFYRALMADSAAFNRRERAAAKREGREPRDYDVVVRIMCAAFGMDPGEDGDDADGDGEAADPKAG